MVRVCALIPPSPTTFTYHLRPGYLPVRLHIRICHCLPCCGYHSIRKWKCDCLQGGKDEEHLVFLFGSLFALVFFSEHDTQQRPHDTDDQS